MSEYFVEWAPTYVNYTKEISENECFYMKILQSIFNTKRTLIQTPFIILVANNNKYFEKPDIDEEQREEYYLSIPFLPHIYFEKCNEEKSEQISRVFSYATPYEA